jgi:hypothetical protein
VVNFCGENPENITTTYIGPQGITDQVELGRAYDATCKNLFKPNILSKTTVNNFR